MSKQYSIAQARDHLPGIVHEVEDGTAVELTRRGKPVAVILSTAEYARLRSGRKSFWDAYTEWRESVDLEDLDLGPETWENLRDRSPGRDVQLELE
jgi:prevent-host-death family protein